MMIVLMTRAALIVALAFPAAHAAASEAREDIQGNASMTEAASQSGDKVAETPTLRSDSSLAAFDDYLDSFRSEKQLARSSN